VPCSLTNFQTTLPCSTTGLLAGVSFCCQFATRPAMLNHWPSGQSQLLLSICNPPCHAQPLAYWPESASADNLQAALPCSTTGLLAGSQLLLTICKPPCPAQPLAFLAEVRFCTPRLNLFRRAVDDSTFSPSQDTICILGCFAIGCVLSSSQRSMRSD